MASGHLAKSRMVVRPTCILTAALPEIFSLHQAWSVWWSIGPVILYHSSRWRLHPDSIAIDSVIGD
ncbi:hypothetical protein I7I48_04514 [Histoplasma ohiense]|nr:hypothetical protein I7I48_04514 [Histoplasma ohiense (nom. inval.)]